MIAFVEGGFKRTVFPHWFYTRLSMCFGHIAHYNPTPAGPSAPVHQRNGVHHMTKTPQIAALDAARTALAAAVDAALVAGRAASEAGTEARAARTALDAALARAYAAASAVLAKTKGDA